MKLYTFDPRKGRKILVGDVQGTNLIKEVDPIKHFMRVVDGYGIQHNALNELRIKGVKKIIIREKGGKVWESTLENWDEHCKVADYGNGKQAFLSLKFMSNLKI